MSAFQQLKHDPTDRTALASWYREIYPTLFMAAFRITFGNRALAEDLCHEAILSFVNRIGFRTVADEHEARAYLKRSISNAHIDELRRRRREENVEPPERTEDPKFADAVDADQRYASLLASLDDAERELLGMMVAGYSLSEMAAALGLSYSNAGVRVHRMRNKIKDLWSDDAVV